MTRTITVALAAATLMTAAPARAENFDATSPAAVAAALQKAGYRAELNTNKEGRPFITSAANGNDFTVDFYGCEGATKCGSFQFYSYYKKDPLYTPALVAEWNASKRFVKLFIDSDGDLSYAIDVTGVGTMSQENFADWIDWFQVMDAELAKFIADKRPAAK